MLNKEYKARAFFIILDEEEVKQDKQDKKKNCPLDKVCHTSHYLNGAENTFTTMYETMPIKTIATISDKVHFARARIFCMM